MSRNLKSAAGNQDAEPALTPKLRFPEFRDAGGWKPTNLSELSNVGLSNGVFNDPKKVGSGYKLINVSDMYIDTTIIEDRLSLLQLSVSDFESNQVEQGDIFFTRSSLVKTGIAVSNIYLGSASDVTFDGHLIRFRADEIKVLPLFAHYLFKSSPIRTQLIARGKTATMTTIGQSDVAGVGLHYPRKQEQQKIAECLTTLDEVIAAQSQKLDALKTHKKGLMQQLFPREGETLPRLRFPEFQDAGEWEVEPFDKLIEVVDGDRGVNYPKTDDFSESGFCLFLSAKNVTKTGFKFEEKQFISNEKDKELRKGKLKRADVVLTTRGTVGQFAYYVDEISYENIRINSGMVILRAKIKKVVPDYLYSFTSSELLRSHIKNIAFGNAQQQITVGEIKKFQLYYPMPDEQKRIATCLTSLDDLITAHSAKLSALKTHKKGLMQQLFPSPDEVEA